MTFALALLFVFHSNFWLNLHQTLFREAARGEGIKPLDVSTLSEAQLRDWNAAVDFYKRRYAGKRLVFDRELATINDALSTGAFPAGLPQPVAEELARVAPIYRAVWWPDHDRQNQEWIAWAKPLASKFGPELKPRLEKAFATAWKRTDVVDVSYFVAEVGGAYTTEAVPHTTISSVRISKDWSGLEVLFHEAAHPLAERLERDLRDECRRRAVDCGDLWHAAQFYAVGSIVRDVLAREEHIEYVPYAEKFGLYERGRWPQYKAALDKVWPKFLSGDIDFATAIKRLVDAL